MTALRHLGRSECGELAQAMGYEWLVTNGIGGFAAGTVCETNTRRYHGLLIASLAPPVGRTLMVAAVDVTVTYASLEYRLATHEFGDGTVAPQGYLNLESFHLDRGMPVWRHAIADALLEKRLLMRPGHNTTLVSLQVLRASRPLHLTLTPLCAYRDYHSHGQGGTGGPHERDGAYHQGTVWAWLIGPFVEAHYRVYGDAATARSFLEPLLLHLESACLGSIGEIFDADPPFAARSCFAQTWSVAEVLRAWLELHAHEAAQQPACRQRKSAWQGNPARGLPAHHPVRSSCA